MGTQLLDLYKLEQVVKWLHTQTDIQLSEWAGEWQKNNLIPAGETMYLLI